jgi:predicted nuclease of predicted toxin-antitoxin system
LKLKLDENLGRRLAQLFQAAGHDAATVLGQQMAGAADSELIQRCRLEGRAIVTLDLDFGNPLLFRAPPNTVALPFCVLPSLYLIATSKTSAKRSLTDSLTKNSMANFGLSSAAECGFIRKKNRRTC